MQSGFGDSVPLGHRVYRGRFFKLKNQKCFKKIYIYIYVYIHIYIYIFLFIFIFIYYYLFIYVYAPFFMASRELRQGCRGLVGLSFRSFTRYEPNHPEPYMQQIKEWRFVRVQIVQGGRLEESSDIMVSIPAYSR